jgi:phage terminase small subunit
MNARERAFVVAFLGPANGVACRAAILAGYAKKSSRVTASRLLTKANIRKAIQKRQRTREDRSIAVADERDRILSTIARDRLADDSDRIRSIIELNRCSGRHSVHLINKGRLTLEQVLSKSRADD